MVANTDQSFKRALRSRVDYSAAGALGVEKLSLASIFYQLLRGPCTSLKGTSFPVSTEPYIQIAVNNISGGIGQLCPAATWKWGRFAVGVLWHVISDGGGGSDTGCSLNRNQLPLKDSKDHPLLFCPRATGGQFWWLHKKGPGESWRQDKEDY